MNAGLIWYLCSDNSSSKQSLKAVYESLIFQEKGFINMVDLEKYETWNAFEMSV